MVVVTAKIEDITSKIEQKFYQKVIELDQKLSYKMDKDKLKQELEETKKLSKTSVPSINNVILKVVVRRLIIPKSVQCFINVLRDGRLTTPFWKLFHTSTNME
ncbi:hypothetical protein HELRODRAFT_165021 [Helobdella robusta]|uniref:Uncharacterized protein n=1 Tax=Helobdella robusta TaxID=6412 RepID=T1EW55_HELRO|nr:hypothetical protein HELRODRAFT_165021 [Helobdella robusta]ESN92890.1 hypothetical protein HELRODRAFT_165021 [Helobdella robusta]